jgi:uncharacterized protein (TIGR03083 family)
MDPTGRQLEALRRSADRLALLVEPLDEQSLVGPSYDSEWSIAQVLSHMGSSAEIFRLYVEAGLKGTDPPGADRLQPIWDSWNSKPAPLQASDAIASDAGLIAVFDGIDTGARESFRMELFGNDTSLADVERMRLAEHAVHSWDVAVALDPTAEVDPEGVEYLVDQLGPVGGWSGRADGLAPVLVVTSDPGREFVIGAAEAVTIRPAGDDDAAGDPGADRIELPAAAFVRLVYGRLDPEHTPAGIVSSSPDLLDRLRRMFPGF